MSTVKETVDKYVGKRLAKVHIDSDLTNETGPYWLGAVVLTFTDSTSLLLVDTNQQCCEKRYFTTDDDLEYYADSTLYAVDVENGSHEDEQFLKIATSKGVFTVCAHNEHNGYYAGIVLEALVVL